MGRAREALEAFDDKSVDSGLWLERYGDLVRNLLINSVSSRTFGQMPDKIWAHTDKTWYVPETPCAMIARAYVSEHITKIMFKALKVGLEYGYRFRRLAEEKGCLTEAQQMTWDIDTMERAIRGFEAKINTTTPEKGA